MSEQSIAGRFVVGDAPLNHYAGDVPWSPEPASTAVELRTFDLKRHKRVRLIDDDGTEWAGVLYVVESDTDGRVPAVREH